MKYCFVSKSTVLYLMATLYISCPGNMLARFVEILFYAISQNTNSIKNFIHTNMYKKETLKKSIL